MSVSPEHDQQVRNGRLFVGVLAIGYVITLAGFFGYTLTVTATPRWEVACLLVAGVVSHTFVWLLLRAASPTRRHLHR